MVKNTSQAQIWNKIIRKLNLSGIKYVLVGGAALVIHGLPRSTLDIDIYVPADKNTLIKLFQFADSLELKSRQRAILKLKDTPSLFANQWICFSYLKEDILDVFFTDKKEFTTLYKNSLIKKDKNLFIKVASLKDIASMKKAAGRSIDFADLKFIKKARKNK